MRRSAAPKPVELQIAEEVAQCYADPLRFVLTFYPWGQPGPLKDADGPDGWQADFLRGLGEAVLQRGFDGRSAVQPIRRATSSGHGIGKSVLVAWLVNWIMATRPHAQGTITANTFTQLETKTWSAIQRWTGMCLAMRDFVCTSTRLYHPDYKSSWFVAPQSCREENSEAFAGQHAADSTSFYIFDEASAIPDQIFEVAEGGLTDGEPMIFQFGNPTRSQGAFHRSCFGAGRDKWHPTIVDSRDCKFTNKTQLAEWVTEYGEDSDFVRVRVRGLPPAASDLQFIDTATVSASQRRAITSGMDDALVCGLDVARGGGDDCVFRFRRGTDGRSIAAVRIPGEQARDSMRLVTAAADLLGRDFNGRRIHTLFIDATGIGGPIGDRLRQLGHRNVIDVQFGSESPDPKFANMRAYMWGRLREWLRIGCIDTSPRLEQDLTGPGYSHDKRDRVLLESKEHMKTRGMDSPDDGDALALTFAMAVGLPKPKPLGNLIYQPAQSDGSWLGS